MVYYLSVLNHEVSVGTSKSIGACRPYFSLSPTPALAFFPCTEILGSSNPQVEVATHKNGEAVNKKEANSGTRKCMVLLRKELVTKTMRPAVRCPETALY